MTENKTILTVLGNKNADKKVLEAAYYVAENFGSHIHMVNVKPDPIINFPYYGEGITTTIIPEMMVVAEKIGDEKSKNSKKTFNDFCTNKNVQKIDFNELTEKKATNITASFSEKTGIEEEIFADLSKIFSLTMYPCPRDDKTFPSLSGLDAMLLEGGASVIVVPEKKFETIGKRIVIAWNGGLSSSRALKASKPFLKKADEVLLVAPKKLVEISITLNELLKSLEFDGIYPKVELMDEHFTLAGGNILENCKKFNADLLVMGAYTSSTIRRLILGGITKYILFNTKIPLFLTH